MHFFRRSIIIAIVLLTVSYSVHAQTVCEKIVAQLQAFYDNTDKINDKQTAPDESELSYVMGMYKDACRELNRVASVTTDKQIINLCRYSRVSMCSRMALIVTRSGTPSSMQVVYDEVHAIQHMAFTTDSVILKEITYITCDKSDGSYYLFNYKDYAPTALQFYGVYMYACYKLEKMEEAESIYEHVKQVNFSTETTSKMRYGIVSLLLHWKIEKHEADAASLFHISYYLVNLYIKDYSYDSLFFPMPKVLEVLNIPELADSTIDSRANAFYNMYLDMKRNPGDFFNEEVRSNMFKQALRSLTVQWGCYGLLETMRYKDPPEIDSIINMNDPALLQKVIANAEAYIGRVGKLKDAIFWKNLARLYRAAGNTGAAEGAEANYNKYNKSK